MCAYTCVSTPLTLLCGSTCTHTHSHTHTKTHTSPLQRATGVTQAKCGVCCGLRMIPACTPRGWMVLCMNGNHASKRMCVVLHVCMVDLHAFWGGMHTHCIGLLHIAYMHIAHVCTAHIQCKTTAYYILHTHQLDTTQNHTRYTPP